MPPDPDEVEKATRLAELQEKFVVPIEGIEEIAEEITYIEQHRIKHILQIKHEWGRLVADPNDWESVARIISKVLAEGEESLINAAENVFSKTLGIGKEVVEVTFRKVPIVDKDGKIFDFSRRVTNWMGQIYTAKLIAFY